MNIWILYTGFALILALALLYRLFRCAHAWELVDKTEFPPKMQAVPGGSKYYVEDLKELCTKKIALVIRCSKCGAARVITEHN